MVKKVRATYALTKFSERDNYGTNGPILKKLTSLSLSQHTLSFDIPTSKILTTFTKLDFFSYLLCIFLVWWGPICSEAHESVKTTDG